MINEKILREAELTGIELPADLTQNRKEAQEKLARLRERLVKFNQQLESVNEEAQTLRAEGVQVIADGKDPAKIQKKINTQTLRAEDVQGWISELEKLVTKAENDLARVEETALEPIRVALVGAHVEMKNQYEIITTERGRDLTFDPRVHATSPPPQQSKSRVAVCEGCLQPIGIFDPDEIKLPIIGSYFKPYGRYEYPPFPPGADYFLHFKCPLCGKRPFGEYSKILTSAGYFVVPDREVFITSESLKAGLAEKNITLTRFAGKLGITQPFLSNILNGKKPLPPELADRAKKTLENWEIEEND